MSTSREDRVWTWIGVAVVAIGCGLRLWDLGEKSLWFDEALSIEDARTIGWKFGSAMHPPLFYYLLHAWIALFGESATAVRLVAVLPGAATVAVVWLTGRRLFGARAGAFAAAVLATASLHVEYSQEVRMYALAAFLAALAGLALAEVLAREATATPRVRWALAIAYTVAAYLAAATHYLAGIVIAAQALALLVSWRETRPIVTRLAVLQAPALVVAGVALAATGYARQVVVAGEFVRNLGGVNQSLFGNFGARLARLPLDLVTQLLPGASLKWLVVASYRWVAVALFDLAAVVGVVALARRTDAPRAARLVVLASALLPLPLLALAVGSEQLRFYLLTAPFLALAVGAGLDAVRPRWAGTAALAAIVVVSLAAVAWYFNPGMDKQPWRRVGRVLTEQTRPGDVVLVNEPHLIIALDRYFAPRPGVDLDGYPELGGVRITPENLDAWLQPLVRDRSRVWFVRMSATASHSDPSSLALAWLSKNLKTVSRVREPGYNGDIDVFLFER